VDNNRRYNILDKSPDVPLAYVTGSTLEPGQRVEVQVEVTASAQAAGLYLSMGAGQLNIHSQSAFTIEIGGRLGTQRLSFLSGTTLEDVARAINARSRVSGVKAEAGETGITLNTFASGMGSFVSIAVVGDGGFSGPAGAGVYRMKGNNANAPDPSSQIGMGSAQAREGIRADARDAAVLVNGVEAQVRGSQVYASTPQFTVVFGLTMGEALGPAGVNAQNRGSFHAFTIEAGAESARATGGGGSAVGGTTGIGGRAAEPAGPVQNPAGSAAEPVPSSVVPPAAPPVTRPVVPPASEPRVDQPREAAEPGSLSEVLAQVRERLLGRGEAGPIVDDLLAHVRLRLAVLDVLQSHGGREVPAGLSSLLGVGRDSGPAGTGLADAGSPAERAASIRESMVSGAGLWSVHTPDPARVASLLEG
jgi:hypothetical protein